MSDLDRLTTSLADRYRIDRQVGRGGMATVYLAHDIKHDRDVAIKVLNQDLSAAIPAERFHREIRIQARLRHPHVVPLLDSGETSGGGLLYYIMPYVEGQSLRQRLIQGPLDVGEAVRLWRDVVDGIAYAHRNGVLHRDIKPENVLIAERHALVADFGVAKALRAESTHAGETLTSIGVAIGTPAYMSPETITGDATADNRADIYALGVLAYEMLAGTPPFSGSTPQSVFAAHLSEEPRPLEEIRPEVSQSLAAIVRNCLHKEPAKRWQSADELLAALDAMTTPHPGATGVLAARPMSRRMLGAAAVILVALIAVGAYAFNTKQARVRWARDVALPELRRLTDANQRDSGLALALQVREILPDDPEVAAHFRRNAASLSLETQPSGASISWASYSRDTSGWHALGVSPLDGAPVPGIFMAVFTLLKVEKPGYATRIIPAGAALRFRQVLSLEPIARHDSGMVLVTARAVVVSRPGGGVTSVRIQPFAIDKYEVSNEQFKRFVDEGGYTRRDLWEPFVAGGRAISWNQGIARFVDRTGRPGPATWEGSAPPRGQERIPVGGVSWYEAAAYAKWAGKQLPNIHQWRHAAGFFGSAWILPHSNMGAQAPVAVTDARGMGPFGTFHMAGNAREWCLNPEGSRRHILGGGWSEASWAFTHTIAEDPFDRSPMNGIRLVKPLGPDSNAALLAADVPRAFRDYAMERPRPASEYRTYRGMYGYDDAPLNSVIEQVDTTATLIRQIITFDAAYGGERVRLLLALPRNARAPYQTVVFGAAANAFGGGSSEELLRQLPFLVEGGRAVAYPVMKNMYERSSPNVDFSNGPNNISGELLGPNTLRDQVIMMMKDLRRTVDYLGTRADIDSARIGYAGFSWGARVGALALAVEPRFKLGVLTVGGLMPVPFRPEIDEINFLPHVTQPTVMLSGRYDDVFPLETSALPYFQLLGTPSQHKRHVVYETQHFVPRAEQIKETLDWLDRYFGPVAR